MRTWAQRGRGIVVVLLLCGVAGCASPTRSVTRGSSGGAVWRSLARVDVAAPLLVGLGLAASGWDDDISDSIAGSGTGDIDQVNLNNRQAYDDASEVLLLTSPLLWGVPTILNHRAPARPLRDEVPASTARKIAVGTGATLATYGAGYLFKDAVDRQRPDEPDDPDANDSMPSGHTYLTSVAATLARHEIGRSWWSRRTKNRLSWAVTAVPVATGYLRVRAKRHYVSDVLVGYAFGAFWGHLANDAFLSPADPVMPFFTIDRRGGNRAVRLGVTFDI